MAYLAKPSPRHGDIAVIGCGFAGAAVVAHLVAQLKAPAHIFVFEPASWLACGPAYSTPRPEHVLNVRANRMGLNTPEDFYDWCQSENGKHALQLAGVTSHTADAFLPRMVYGAYLQQRWQETLSTAREHGIHLEVVPASITSIDTAMQLHTKEHGSFFARAIVCSSGSALHDTTLWNTDFRALAEQRTPIRIIGSGLSAIDAILSLAQAGYTQPIPCVSRHGKWPQIHSQSTALPVVAIPPSSRLSVLLRNLRNAMREQKDIAWQNTLDALRPHTPALWNALAARSQRRFLTRYFSLWNRFRHRMPPQVAAMIHRLESTGQLTLKRANLPVAMQNQEACVLDCRGPHYGMLPEYLTTLLTNRTLQRHANGAGLASSAAGVVGCAQGVTVYAIGALVLGQWLETTAVPELRTQARDIGHDIATRMKA